MNRFSSALICLLAALFLVCCRGAYDPSTRFTPDQLARDFRVLRQSLEAAHPGIYRRVGKSQLDRLFLEAESSLGRPLDVFEFYRVLSPLVAAVRCGHTNVELPDFVKEQNSARAASFPVLIKIIGGRIFAWRDLSGGGDRLAGAEILSVNGIPAAEIVSTMLASTGGDGDIQTSRVKRIEGWGFVEKLTPLTGLQSPFELTVADSAGVRREQIRLDGVAPAALRENWKARFPQDQQQTRSGEVEFVDGGRVARMTVREFGGFVDDERRRGLEDFYRDAFAQMAANRTEVLILDLRDNGGGDDRLGTLLLSYLLDQPFVHYRDIVARDTVFALDRWVRLPYRTERRGDGLYHIIDYPNLGVLRPSSPAFTGRVLVLMNGGSFSTTAEVISQLHSHGRAEFIGEEAGGAYDGNNSGTIARVTLPHSGITLLVPLMSYYLSVGGGGADNSRGVRPDYPVDYSITDYLSNSDKAMALALEKAGPK